MPAVVAARRRVHALSVTNDRALTRRSVWRRRRRCRRRRRYGCGAVVVVVVVGGGYDTRTNRRSRSRHRTAIGGRSCTSTAERRSSSADGIAKKKFTNMRVCVSINVCGKKKNLKNACLSRRDVRRGNGEFLKRKLCPVLSPMRMMCVRVCVCVCV